MTKKKTCINIFLYIRSLVFLNVLNIQMCKSILVLLNKMRLTSLSTETFSLEKQITFVCCTILMNNLLLLPLGFYFIFAPILLLQVLTMNLFRNIYIYIHILRNIYFLCIFDELLFYPLE